MRLGCPLLISEMEKVTLEQVSAGHLFQMFTVRLRLQLAICGPPHRGLLLTRHDHVTGQDLFIPGRKFIISGIDVLEVDSALNRKEIEAILKDAREMPVDEYAGWSKEAEIVETQMAFGEDCIDAWFDKSLA